MTVVFVHGVPETASLWDELRHLIKRPSHAVALPGFGRGVPEGFDRDKDAYVTAILEELESVEGPIDLVGHDWGSLLTLRIATEHGIRLRSWVADIGYVSHPDYAWHDYAQLWQTTPAGEHWMKETVDDPTGFFDVLAGLGVPAGHLPNMRSAFDDDMAESILTLYRSATPNIHAHWNTSGRGGTLPRGLILHAENDPFDNHEKAGEVAERLGADFSVLPNVGHFWMIEDPSTAADILDDWIRGVESAD